MSASPSPVLPATLALVDRDPAFSRSLVQALADQGVAARWFDSAEALLSADQPFGFDFYVLDAGLPALPGLPALDGLGLLQVLRRRSQAGALLLSAALAPELADRALEAGADLCLAKPVPAPRVVLGVRAVFRRSGQAPPAAAAHAQPQVLPAPEPGAAPAWQVVLDAHQLRLPDGQVIGLSSNDVNVLRLLAQSPGHAATRAQLSALLNLAEDSSSNLLTATMYRLRRRIERHYTGVAPLQSRANVGYIFKAPLRLG